MRGVGGLGEQGTRKRECLRAGPLRALRRIEIE